MISKYGPELMPRRQNEGDAGYDLYAPYEMTIGAGHTVTFDTKEALAELNKGRVEFRADKTGVVHLAIGKVNMDAEKIAENAQATLDEIMRKKPVDAKGEFVLSVALSSTMGPGVHVDFKALQSK